MDNWWYIRGLVKPILEAGAEISKVVRDPWWQQVGMSPPRLLVRDFERDFRTILRRHGIDPDRMQSIREAFAALQATVDVDRRGGDESHADKQDAKSHLNLTDAQCRLLDTVRDHGPIRQMGILDVLAKAGHTPSEGTTKNYLAELVRRGYIESTKQGYVVTGQR